MNASAPSNGAARAIRERRGDVADVLEVLEPAVADRERRPGGDGLDRLGRLARDPEVAADAVDRPGSEADARDPAVEPVDPGVQLVADLERPVVGQGRQPDLVADRPRRVGVGGPVDGRRAGVDHPLDLPFQGRGGLEDRERPEDVHPRPEQRVGPAGRDLEPGQVKQMRRLDPLRRRQEGGGVGDVALDEMDRSRARRRRAGARSGACPPSGRRSRPRRPSSTSCLATQDPIQP